MNKTKAEALQFWMTKDGLMSLEKHDGFKQECGNDNGILFTVLFYYHLYLLDRLDESDRTRFITTEKSLIGPEPGLYNRAPMRKTRDEAHDNYKALVLGSVLFDYPKTTNDILEYGLKNGFVYENVKDEEIVDPHMVERRQSWWYKWLGFDITRWRQGSDIAFYKLCAGYMPTPPQYLWLLVSLIAAMFYKLKNEEGVVQHHSDHVFLTWIVMEAIFLKDATVKKKPRWQSLYIPIKILYTIWKFIIQVKTDDLGMASVMKAYFVDDHPIVRLAEELREKQMKGKA